MKHLNKFNQINESEDKIFDEIKQALQSFIDGSGLSAEVDMDTQAPSAILMVNKKNSCFTADSMNSQFASDMLHDSDGLQKGEFMGDWTTLDDMHSQLRVINSISNSAKEEIDQVCECDFHRCWLNGDHILIEYNLHC